MGFLVLIGVGALETIGVGSLERTTEVFSLEGLTRVGALTSEASSSVSSCSVSHCFTSSSSGY